MKLYPAVKMFVLAFMLGVYVLFLATVIAAHHAGGWIVVMVDKYREGLLEVILLSSILPLASYVTFKEIRAALHEIRRERKRD